MDENNKTISWTARNDFINSTPFLCGFFAAFGNSFKNKIQNYEDRKKKFFNLFNESSEDPLQFKILNNILEEENKKSKKWGDTIRKFFNGAFDIFLRGEDDFKKIWMQAVNYV